MQLIFYSNYMVHESPESHDDLPLPEQPHSPDVPQIDARALEQVRADAAEIIVTMLVPKETIDWELDALLDDPPATD